MLTPTKSPWAPALQVHLYGTVKLYHAEKFGRELASLIVKYDVQGFEVKAIQTFVEEKAETEVAR
jgi:hypothetical protein